VQDHLLELVPAASGVAVEEVADFDVEGGDAASINEACFHLSGGANLPEPRSHNTASAIDDFAGLAGRVRRAYSCSAAGWGRGAGLTCRAAGRRRVCARRSARSCWAVVGDSPP
jgi:hypothetical protein